MPRDQGATERVIRIEMILGTLTRKGLWGTFSSLTQVKRMGKCSKIMFSALLNEPYRANVLIKVAVLTLW
jgi:hypothetical protein